MKAAGGVPGRGQRVDPGDRLRGVPVRLPVRDGGPGRGWVSPGCAPSSGGCRAASGLSAVEVDTASLQVRPPVVRLADGDDVPMAGRGQGDAQGQVVGLGPGVDQEDGVERVGQQRREPLGELDDGGVVEPGVGVEPPQLPVHRVGQPRVTVAQDGDVVHRVQVHPAVGVDEVLAPAALDPRRRGVVVLLHGRERRRPARQQVVLALGRVPAVGTPSSGLGSATTASHPGSSSAVTNSGTSSMPSSRHADAHPGPGRHGDERRRPRARASRRLPRAAPHRRSTARGRRRTAAVRRPATVPSHGARRVTSRSHQASTPVATFAGGKRRQRRGPGQPGLAEGGDDRPGAGVHGLRPPAGPRCPGAATHRRPGRRRSRKDPAPAAARPSTSRPAPAGSCAAGSGRPRRARSSAVMTGTGTEQATSKMRCSCAMLPAA